MTIANNLLTSPTSNVETAAVLAIRTSRISPSEQAERLLAQIGQRLYSTGAFFAHETGVTAVPTLLMVAILPLPVDDQQNYGMSVVA